MTRIPGGVGASVCRWRCVGEMFFFSVFFIIFFLRSAPASKQRLWPGLDASPLKVPVNCRHYQSPMLLGTEVAQTRQKTYHAFMG